MAYGDHIKLPRVKADRYDALWHNSGTLDNILPFYVEHLKTPALLNLASPEEWNEATIIFTRRPSGNKFMVSFLSNRGHFQFSSSDRRSLHLFQKEEEGMRRRKRREKKENRRAVQLWLNRG